MSLPAAGTDIRVLVTRHPEQKVSIELGGVITIEISKPSNYADILAYVSDSLKNIKIRTSSCGAPDCRESR